MDVCYTISLHALCCAIILNISNWGRVGQHHAIADLLGFPFTLLSSQSPKRWTLFSLEIPNSPVSVWLNVPLRVYSWDWNLIMPIQCNHPNMLHKAQHLNPKAVINVELKQNRSLSNNLIILVFCCPVWWLCSGLGNRFIDYIYCTQDSLK